MKIYVASSWRNPYQPKVVEKLKEIGHEVYDFRNPKKGDNGFHWSEIDPLWESWTPEEYFKALSHPIAEKGFKLDFDAMKWADCCVMVLPCGRSANTEAGWMKGVGKEVYVYMPIQQEPELMYKIYDKVLTNFWELEYIGRECHGKIPEDCTAFGNIEGKACNHCSKFGLSHYASQPSDVSDEMIEKWAKMEAFGDISDNTFESEKSEHTNAYFRYKALIQGAKAMRDGQIKPTIEISSKICIHPKEMQEPYHDGCIVCKKCNCIISQFGKDINPPSSLSMGY